MKNNIALLFLLFTSSVSFSQCWKMVSIGKAHANAIKKDGTLWASGIDIALNSSVKIDSFVQIGIENDWDYICTVENISFAIKKDGSLWGWGVQNNNSLGNGDTTNPNVSVYVKKPVQIGKGKVWTKVVSSNLHSAALASDGTLWTWGVNKNGQLGDNTYINKNIPTKVESDLKWIDVAVGWNYTIGLKEDSTIWGWGANNYNQCGYRKDSNNNLYYSFNYPIKNQDTFRDWIKIAASNKTSYFIRANGTLWAIGENDPIIYGTGIRNGLKELIDSSNHWIDISTTYYQNPINPSDFAGNFVLLKDIDNFLYSWGDNQSGQLGYYTINNNRSSEIIKVGERNNKFDSCYYFTTGAYHSLAIKEDGSFWFLNWPSYNIKCVNSQSSVISNINNFQNQLFYPNPTNNHIFLHESLLNYNFEVYSLNLQKVISGKVTNQNLYLSLSPEIYFIKFYNDSKTIIQKLIIN